MRVLILSGSYQKYQNAAVINQLTDGGRCVCGGGGGGRMCLGGERVSDDV